MPESSMPQAFALAVQHHLAGRLSEAESIYRRILAADPRHADSLHYLGLIAHQVGRNENAADIVRRALALQPENPEMLNNLGNILRKLGEFAESAACCREAVRRKPDYPLAHNNLGLALYAQGKFEEAIAAYGQAIAFDPGYAEAYNNLGIALHETDKMDEAVARYRRAIELQPDCHLAWNNLGGALRETGQIYQASEACRRALDLRPDLLETHNNLGSVLLDQGRIEESIAAYREALSIQPDFVVAHSNLLFSLNYHVDLPDSAIAEEHREWNRLHALPLREQGLPLDNERSSERRLRVGYVSPDFREHSVAYFLEGLLENHDHAQVEVYCYSDVNHPDSVTKRLRESARQWREIVGMTDQQVSDLIRNDRIDILVDLAGHTARNRLPVFARKPAPVQVTWLGYSNTTGLDAIDYRITDAFADPPGTTENLHSERLVRLPKTFACFRPMEDAPSVMPRPPENGSGITFGSFHTLAKLNDRLLSSWAEIMSKVPASRLLLVANGLDEPAIRNRVIERFDRSGINADRLDCRGKQPPNAYLRLHQQVDILLDSHPFSGHTITCHALWMGMPVVTMVGQRHCSRMVGSVLSNIGHPEWIATNPDEYVAIAVALARDPARLASIRSSLREKMAASPIMDARGFARDMEAAYRSMWRAWCETPVEPSVRR